MAVKSKADLKALFENGDVPDAQAFIDLIDSILPINSSGGYAGEGSTSFRVQGQTYRVVQDSEGFKITDGTGQPVVNLTNDGLKFLRMQGSVTYATEYIYGWNMENNTAAAFDFSSYLTRDNVVSISILVFSDDGTVSGSYKNDGGAEWYMQYDDTDGRVIIAVGSAFSSYMFRNDGPEDLRCKLIIGYNKLAT